MENNIKFNLAAVFIVLTMSIFSDTHAENRVIDLAVTYKTVNFSGRLIKAISINNQIPAPTLRFTEGDNVTLNVHNHLDTGTAIHWHGILLPWEMDGVEHVSQKAIAPGCSFKYKFTLKQSGSYWYHAHAGFQEQQGLYGAFIIEPKISSNYKQNNYHYNKDYVVVLSDWSNTNPNQIFANLKKDGDYYSPKFPLQPSLVKFMRDYRKGTTEQRKKLIADYKMMQMMRMSIYDLADVAYDAFLLNGHTRCFPWVQSVSVGDTVRLRFVGAGASTIFHIKIPNTKMQVVHVQGNDIEPYCVDDLTIAPGETYDVLVKIERNTPYYIYAESADTLGAAVGALVSESNQKLDFDSISPFPEPAPVMAGMHHGSMGGMDHDNMKMNDDSMKMEHTTIKADHNLIKMHNSTMKMSHDTMPLDHGAMKMDNSKMDMPVKSYPSLTMGTKYQNLKSEIITNDPDKPVQEIKMTLSGFMGKYIWFINGVPEYLAQPIMIHPDKRYRLIFTNPSMMHHPMHLHGHWLILRNGHGAYDPKLHTIDVAPGATAVADFDANANGGQWFFHCHHLYHMMAGMARIFRYAGFDLQHHDISSMGHLPGSYLTGFLDIGLGFSDKQSTSFKVLLGGDYNKILLETEDAEIKNKKIERADLDIFYWHSIGEFWALKGGINYVYRPAKSPYIQPGIGIEGLMPYCIDTNIRAYYHNGSIKLDVDLFRDSQITNNFFIRTGVRGLLASKTVIQDEVGCGFNQLRLTIRPYYRLGPGFNIFTEFEYEQSYGVQKQIQLDNGESVSDSRVTVGFAILL